MKLTNPLHYPLAVLAGGIVLVLGVRIVQLPSWLILPVAGAITTGGALVLKSKEPETINLGNPALERELATAKQQAQMLVNRAENLRNEADKMLTSSTQMELLTAVQYACDRTLELPGKIDQFSRRLYGDDALLSVSELQQQLREVEAKKINSAGIALQQLNQLGESLARNINLAQQGMDARQAQIISLATVITDSAGVLQELQNKLRTSNLNDSEELQELRSLSDEISSLQDNLNILVS
ncbi:MAG: hypothetical protein DSM107014_14355 [Gomphosphaeria aponina SAG 52.96 = DSM 107014]|uniref:Uncharacterized protein n=1 Tax=Gomphosphaeria aponina SAG 52.96 = DSM 107014 TaxID=1521640 RepID=A0A941GSL4_9CHRO|nr:hypothetical protein [Gomphosphaeria aponina SAG 52.96 = DSM 107014]